MFVLFINLEFTQLYFHPFFVNTEESSYAAIFPILGSCIFSCNMNWKCCPLNYRAFWFCFNRNVIVSSMYFVNKSTHCTELEVRKRVKETIVISICLKTSNQSLTRLTAMHLLSPVVQDEWQARNLPCKASSPLRYNVLFMCCDWSTPACYYIQNLPLQRWSMWKRPDSKEFHFKFYRIINKYQTI